MANGEDKILNLLGKYFPNAHPHFLMGRGDDCALIQIPLATAMQNSFSASHLKKNKDACLSHPSLLAVTSDVFAENAHFRTSYFSPAQIGHKALAVNISDLAGNGAKPSAFSLNLTLTDEQDFAWLEEFFASMAKLANTFSVGLSGGDLAKVPTPPSSKNVLAHEKGGLNIAITAWGDYSHGGLPLQRHHYISNAKSAEGDNQTQSQSQQAKEGDILFVVGQIGLARTGLYLLEESKSSADVQEIFEKYPMAYEAHLSPMPLVNEGLFLSSFALEHPIFLMDISDGLMRDIPRLLSRQGLLDDGSQKLGAKITLEEQHIPEEVQKYCQERNISCIDFAFRGGEDYGLLGICSQEAFEKLQDMWALHSLQNANFAKLWKLGTVDLNTYSLNHQDVEEGGFDHFS